MLQTSCSKKAAFRYQTKPGHMYSLPPQIQSPELYNLRSSYTIPWTFMQNSMQTHIFLAAIQEH